MTNPYSNDDRIDQYLRDGLSPEETEAFELELMESGDLQREVETVLSLRGAVALDAKRELASNTGLAKPSPATPPAWQRLAMAAAVMLAVLSTVMWWKAGNDVANLERQVQSLAGPVAEVLSVPVPIMRSAGGQTPDVIVQKPEGRVAIVLDIELGLTARQQESLNFSLVGPEGATVLSWQSEPEANNHARVVIPGEQIPASRLWLHIDDAGGNTLERRLLEFR